MSNVFIKDCKMKNKLITSLLILFVSIPVFSQENYWNRGLNETKSEILFESLHQNTYHTSTLNMPLFKSTLKKVSLRESNVKQNVVVILLPNNEGKLERFRVQEVSIFSKELAKKFPNIKAYVGYGIDTPGARARFTVSPQGLQSMISFPNKPRVFTVPVRKGDAENYLTYKASSRKNNPNRFECLTESDRSNPDLNFTQQKDADDQILRTLRIAISTTGEYTNFWDDGNNANGDAQVDALAQVVSTLNRTNEVFEVDMAVTFQLVSGTSIIYPDATTDPYSSIFSSLLGEVQSNMGTAIGDANFDIGHLFHFGSDSSNLGNGVACLGCVCVDGQKGRGVSAHIFEGEGGSPYMSDYFDIDYVPHEMGHQMGANHTWSFNSGSAGVSVEPGSGTTIMGYAGITGNNDVQTHSDAYFNYHSIREILTRLETRTCWTSTAITNNAPVANAGSDFTIPRGTAFMLNGGATTDADNSDVLMYSWEQIDHGVSNFGNFGPTRTSGATFRSRPPNTSPIRYMPLLSRILSGDLTETNPVKNAGNTSWETVSTVARTLKFALTVRDRSEANGVGQFPQSSYDDMTITVDDASGPFAITSQATAVVWTIGENQDITWDVAGTNSGAINAVTVNIKLSIDGGLTFPIILASNENNDGSHTITVPDIGTTVVNARILIEPTNNIFLAVNSSNFTIQPSSASVDDEIFHGFKLYPNPSQGIINLEFQLITNDVVMVQVFDLAGRTVFVKNYKNVLGLFKEEIEFKNISGGLYLMKVINGGKFSTHKIVIEK